MRPWLRAGLIALLAVPLLIGGAPEAWVRGLSALAQESSTAMVPNWAPAEPEAVAAKTSTILTARVGDHGSKTRFVLEMSEAADFRIFSLENPDRMVIDFEAAEWHAGPPRSASVGVIAGHRHGVRDDGAIRLVLDLTGPARVLESFYPVSYTHLTLPTKA